MAVTKAKTKKTVAKKINGKSNKSKTQSALALLRRPKGATRVEILKALGWAAVSVQQLTANSGGKLKIDKSERPFTYRV
jgi:hypothetical protein